VHTAIGWLLVAFASAICGAALLGMMALLDRADRRSRTLAWTTVGTIFAIVVGLGVFYLIRHGVPSY
jgi:hypothetical protein